MKRSFVLSLSLLACMNAEPPQVGADSRAANTPTVFHSVWRGAGASAYFGDLMVGPIGGYVNIWEMGMSMGLSFEYFAVDPSSQVCFDGPMGSFCYYTRYSYDFGGGPISMSDITSNPHSVVLNAAVGPGTNFSTNHCDVDYTTWSWNCTSGASGTVSARWDRTEGFSIFTSGVTRSTFGTMTEITSGSYTTSSAIASGSILGHAFSTANGNMTDTRNTNVTKDINFGGGPPDAGAGGPDGSGGM